MSDAGATRNLAVRVATAVVLFPVAVWLTWRGGLPFAGICSAAAALCTLELLLMVQTRVRAPEIFAVAMAGLLPLAAWFAWMERGNLFSEWVTLGAAGAAMALLALHLVSDRPIEEVWRAAAVATLAWLYTALLVTTVLGIRLRFGFPWVILAFVVTWANDTLAFFAGRLLGRHKLFPRISPKKTWEGFVGGAFGSVAGAFVVRALLLPGLPLWACWAVGLGGALLAPVGDLVESMLKRSAGVKDSGRILPGHGGLLDRIDALLFVGPWIYAVAMALRG
jgi:phosphatidate cytidylyltransferase